MFKNNPSSLQIDHNYRPEIDGLRAVAVLPVILFHAGFEWFGGGFIGVDVFFVISGYLITGIILKDIQAKNFSLITFYERRARRILPALFFVILTCIIVAWLWMPPNKMLDFSKSVVATILFVSNIFLARNSGYFSPSAEEKPLLHMWSLAVEEQYYIIFPVFLLLAWRWRSNYVFWLIILAVLVSFAIGEWGTQKGTRGHFYSTAGRAWELLVGSLLSVLVYKHSVKPHNGLALLGLLAIIAAIVLYDSQTPFPSRFTLLPVIGTALLLLFADQSNFVGRFLSLKPIVAIGLISYSAYLWHQPLFAFLRIRLINDPPDLLMGAMVFVSLILAALTWKFVEQPFRQRVKTGQGHIISRKAILAFSVAGAFAFLSFGGIGYLSNGFANRYDDHVRQLAGFEKLQNSNNANACIKQEGYPSCIIGDVNNISAAIWGDSHSFMLWSALNQYGQQNQQGFVGFASGGCPAAIDVYANPIERRCYKYNKESFEWILANDKIKLVVLASRWTLAVEKYPYDNGVGGREGGRVFWLDIVDSQGNRLVHKNESERKQAVLAKYKETVEKLIQAGKAVAIIQPVPEMGWHIPNTLMKYAQYHNKAAADIYIPLESYENRNSMLISFFKALKKEYPLKLAMVNPAGFICDPEKSRCYGARGGQAYYLDDDHLSNYAATILIDRLAAAIKSSW